jgi:hypothetical protein
MSKKLIQQIRQLQGLQLAGKPQDSWVASNKEVLMNQIQPQSTANVSNNKSFFGDNFYYAKFFSEILGTKVLRPVGVFSMVVLVFLGYNAVATMATTSIPGDVLYPFKTASENVQLSLTMADEKKVELQLNFLSRRTDELQQIAKQTDSSASKKAKITQAVKKITSDVNTVKASMAKISMASVSPSALAVAKQVDDKTLKIEKDITNVHASLPADVKQDVAQDVKTALATTDDTGAQMLTMIVKTTEVKGTTAESDSDIAGRITERIKSMEIDIKNATDKVNEIATSTPVVTSSNNATSTSELIKPSDIVEMKDKLKKAQEALDEAKTLLGKKEFDASLKKIQECKDTMNGVIDQTPVNTTTSTIPVATSTPSAAK